MKKQRTHIWLCRPKSEDYYRDNSVVQYDSHMFFGEVNEDLPADVPFVESSPSASTSKSTTASFRHVHVLMDPSFITEIQEDEKDASPTTYIKKYKVNPNPMHNLTVQQT